jgi:hypothetical protein
MYRQAHVGIVIRPHGEVPFDDECAHELRDAIIAHLVNEGHQIETFDVPGKKHKHLRIKNWQPERIGS